MGRGSFGNKMVIDLMLAEEFRCATRAPSSSKRDRSRELITSLFSWCTVSEFRWKMWNGNCETRSAKRETIRNFFITRSRFSAHSIKFMFSIIFAREKYYWKFYTITAHFHPSCLRLLETLDNIWNEYRILNESNEKRARGSNPPTPAISHVRQLESRLFMPDKFEGKTCEIAVRWGDWITISGSDTMLKTQMEDHSNGFNNLSDQFIANWKILCAISGIWEIKCRWSSTIDMLVEFL